MDCVPLFCFFDSMFLGLWMVEQRGGEWKHLKTTGNEEM
jgi:hypothetical protein